MEGYTNLLQLAACGQAFGAPNLDRLVDIFVPLLRYFKRLLQLKV
jgi:hypothetical protein